MADNDVNVTLKATTTDFQNNMKAATAAAQSSFAGLRLSAEEAKKVFGDFSGSASQQAKQLQAALTGTTAAAKTTTAAFTATGAAAKTAALDFQAIINSSTGVSRGLRSATESGEYFERIMNSSGRTAAQLAAIVRNTGLEKVKQGANEASGGLQNLNSGLRLNRQGLMELQASGVNAFQALASGMGVWRVAEMEGAQVFGALIQGGILTKNALMALSPEFYAVAGAAGILGAAFISLAVHAKEVRDAIMGVNDAAVLLGHTGFNPEATRAYISELQRLPGVSVEVAGQIARAVEMIPYASDKTKDSLGKLAVALAQVAHTDVPTAINELSKAATSGAAGVLSLDDRFHFLTDAQRQALGPMKDTGDVIGAQSILVDGLNARLSTLTQRYDQLFKMQHSGSRWAGAAMEALKESPLPVASPIQPLGQSQTQQIEEKTLGTKRQIADIEAQITTMEQNSANLTGKSKEDADDTLTLLRQKLQTTKASFEAEKAGGVDVLSNLRTQLADQQAATSGSLAQQASERKKFWQDALNDQALTAKQRTEIEREVAAAQKQINDETRRVTLASLDVEIAATRDGSTERVAILQRYAELVKSMNGAQSVEYIAAQARVATAERQFQQQSYQTKIAQMNDDMALLRAGTDEKIAILKQESELAAKQFGEQSKEYADALRRETLEQRAHQAEIVRVQTEAVDTQKEIDLLKLEDKKAGYEQEAQLGRLKGSEKINDLRALEQAEYDIEKKAIQDKLGLMLTDPTMDPATQRRLYAQLEILDQQHQNKISQIDRQAVTDAKARWTQMVAPIDNAFKQVTNGILQGTQTWKQVVGNAVDSIVAATAQGAEQMLSSYVTSLLAGEPAQSTSASSQIGTNAATAASGAYSSAASIPYVGWILGPAAAAAAFVAVMAYKSSIGSFAVGTDNVPHDMTAQIHKGEIIVPQTMASAIRGGDMTLGGPGQAGVTNASSSTNFHYAPTIMAPPDPDIGDMLTRHGSKMLKFIEMSMRDGKLKMPRA